MSDPLSKLVSVCLPDCGERKHALGLHEWTDRATHRFADRVFARTARGYMGCLSGGAAIPRSRGGLLLGCERRFPIFLAAGRLKLNGEIRGYSPLSRLVELEGLETGVAGKRALWQALSSVFHGDPRLAQFNLDGLIARAEEQLEGIGEQRVAAAPDALTESAATASR